MVPRPQRAVIVGCGRIAGGYNELDESRVLTHAAAYRALGTSIVGCCDRDGSRALAFARRWSVAESGTDLGLLLEKTRPDVVSICTPPAGRLTMLARVLGAPTVRAVLLEKPVGASHRESESIARLAEGFGRPVLVNYCRAYDPFYRDLRDYCASAGVRTLRQIVARYYGNARTNASHLIERVIDMAGTPVAAERLSGSDEAPWFCIRFNGRELTAVFLPTVGCDYSPVELDLLFETGRIRVIDSERRVEAFVSRTSEDFQDVRDLVFTTNPFGGAPSHESILNAVGAALRTAEGQVRVDDVLQRGVMVDWILDEVGAR